MIRGPQDRKRRSPTSSSSGLRVRLNAGPWAWISRFCVAAVALWFFLFAVEGDQLPYLGYLNAFAPLWAAVALLIGIFFLWRREWVFGLPTIMLSLWILSFGFAITRPAQEQGRTFRLVTASLRTLNTDMDAAAANFAALAPDVIAVQEPNDPDELLRRLRARSRRPWQMISNGSVAILSLSPIEPLPPPVPQSLAARIRIGEAAPIVLWTLRAPKSYDEPLTITNYFSALQEALQNRPPDILAGDFNATPWNHGYRVVHGYLSDAFRQAGFGFGFSFPSRARHAGMLFPFAAIDHVFISRRLAVADVRVARASAGADHLPLVADLFFAGAPAIAQPRPPFRATL